MNLTTHETIRVEDIPVVIRREAIDQVHHYGSESPKWETGEAAIVQPISCRLLPTESIRSSTGETSPSPHGSTFLKGSAEAVERSVIRQALEKSHYHRGRTARMLGISTTTLWRKMKRLWISTETS